MSLEAKVENAASHVDDNEDNHSHVSYDYDEDANSIIAIASDVDEEADLPPHAPQNQRPSTKESLEGEPRTSVQSDRDAVKTKVITYSESPTSPPTQLHFDLNQHWERSLLRELEAIDQQTMYTKLFPRPQRGPLVLLRHTESRDMAVDIERDDMTLTDASTMSIPYRSQMIHRLGSQGRAPIFDDETEVSTTTAEVKSLNTHSAALSHAESDSSETIEETREDSTVASSDSKKKKPIHRKTDSAGSSSYQELLRSRAFSEEKRMLSPWIEIEQASDDDDYTNGSYALEQHPACACWGYNILDFWLPPPDAQIRKRRIAPSTRSTAPYNSLLGRVNEHSTSPPQPERKRMSRRERNFAEVY